MQVNNIQGQSFRGVWGDVQMVKGKLSQHYYPFKDETEEEIKKEVEMQMSKINKLNTSASEWTPNIDKVSAIVTKPLIFTKEEFLKFNRGFLSDALAKFLTK